MKKFKRLLSIFALVMIFTVMFSGVVYAAWAYRFPTTVRDTSAVGRTYYPVVLGYTGQTFIDAGKINANGLNSNMQVGASNVKYMLSTTNVLSVIPNLPASGQEVVSFYTGYTPDQTGFPLITGDGGYITKTDDPDMELANDFETESKGYLTMPSAAPIDILSKTGAFSIGASSSSTVSATIWGTYTLQIDQAAVPGASGLYGADWEAQTFTPAADFLLTQASLNLILGAGAPAGDFTVSIRATSGGVPTGSDLVSVTVNANTLGAGWNVFTFPRALYVSNGMMYAVVARHPTGTVANYWAWSQAGNVYAGGTKCTSADSGVIWASVAANDKGFRIYSAFGVTATGITSGIRKIVVTATGGGGNITISVYDNLDVLIDDDTVAIGAATVPNNGNSWVLMSNASPYLDYYKHSVDSGGGLTLIAWYEPNTMLIATAVVDRQGGDENAVITWGANTSITITYGAMESYEDTSATSADVGGFTMPSANLPSTWFAQGENLSNLPFYDSFYSVSQQTGQPLQTIYFIATIGFAFGLFLLVIMFTRSALLASLSMIIVFFIASNMTIVPMWIPFVILIVQVGILYIYRQAS